MTAECCRCAKPAEHTLGAQDFCGEHYAAIREQCREAIAERERQADPFGGTGRQDGPLRADYGPGWADLRCDRCSATWVGKIGDPCTWCDRQYEIILEIQREILLHPDLPDPESPERLAKENEWAERLGRAVACGLIQEDVALRRLKRYATPRT